MLSRCYNGVYQSVQPTYIGCSVAEEWHSFMTFKAWMEAQDWQGNELDKDILVKGNKIYSPSTCVFVGKITNAFTIDCGAARGDLPIGVNWYKRDGNYVAKCSNPFTKKQEHLGYFDCPSEAHEAWRKRKHEHALRLANLQNDARVANALRLRYTS